VTKTVTLGFEVGSGKPVSIPLRHMVVTGQTQEAGKTTTLEALIGRAGVPAIAFVTKRGEHSFADGRRIAPYFRERADWQFVASVLEATMRERLRFERAWIMRASKGARTLADVHRNVRRLMESAKGLSADVYLTLDAYLEIVVPRVASVRFASTLDLLPGLNVLDLSDRDRFPPELQGLVMRSVLEWIYERADGTITIIPEAWEFLPQGRGSPVKLSAVELIRKGAGLSNYVWLDSQDIGGVDKELLRSCPVWLLGVQREANEIKRVLENIPAGIAKPKASDVATLQRGQFYACFGETVVKTYVQPAWMVQAEAVGIARGTLAIQRATSRPIAPPEETMTSETDKKLDTLIALLSRQAAPAEPTPAASVPVPTDEEALYQRFKARLVKKAPALLKVLAVVPEIQVETETRVIKTDGSTLGGRIALMALGGFFDTPKSTPDTTRELKRTGADPGPNTKRELDRLRNFGLLTEENDGFQSVAAMKKNIRKVQS
jgi:hypothetical protein